MLWFSSSSASGSALRMARSAVGAVKKHVDLVVVDEPPERPGIGGADGLALVEHRGGAGDQRPVHDVGMADDPADVRCGEHGVPRPDPVDVAHRPVHGHRVAAAVADHALGRAGGAGGVEDVERVRRGDGHRVDGLRGRGQFVPVVPDGVAACVFRALVGKAVAVGHDHGGHVVGGLFHGIGNGGQVFHAPGRLDASRRRHDRLGCGVVDARGEFLGANPPKTTECTAPMRAQASIAICACGIMGR